MMSLFNKDGQLNKGLAFDEQEDMVVKEEPVTTEHYCGKEIWDQRQTLGRKFSADDVAKDRKLANTAEWFTLDVYNQERSHWSFNFMRDMQLELAHRGRLTPAQAKGVLNVMVAVFKNHLEQNRQKRQQQHDTSNDTEMARTATRQLANGYYTVVADDKHWTIRLRPAHWNEQALVFGILIGPDNTSQYANFGFIEDGKIQYWQQANYRGSRRPIGQAWKDAVEFLLGASDDQIEGAQQMYAKRSGNCYVCGRVLTDPTSIELGIGPVCRTKGAM